MLSSVPENNISVEEMDIDSFLNEASNDYEMIQNKVKNTRVASPFWYCSFATQTGAHFDDTFGAPGRPKVIMA